MFLLNKTKAEVANPFTGLKSLLKTYMTCMEFDNKFITGGHLVVSLSEKIWVFELLNEIILTDLTYVASKLYIPTINTESYLHAS